MGIVLAKKQLYKINEVKGKLTAIGPAFHLRRTRHGTFANRHTVQVFQCECGSIACLDVNQVKRGETVSCGCVQKTKSRAFIKAHETHLSTKTRLYCIWRGMRRRCHDPRNAAWNEYGGRGIVVCEEWRDSFETFKTWAIANGYEDGLEIDRFPDNGGNYEPMNCRWTTTKKNCRNKRNNVRITAWGETKTAEDWADDCRCRVSSDLLRFRVSPRPKNRIWTPEAAISTPALPNGRARIRPELYINTTGDL